MENSALSISFAIIIVLVSSACSTAITLAWALFILRRVSKWPDAVTAAITNAPTLIESLTKLSLGVQEIIALIIRAGGLNRIINPPRTGK